MALGQVFSEYFGFPWQFSFHRLLHIHHLSSGWYDRRISGRRTKWTQSHPTPRNLKKLKSKRRSAASTYGFTCNNVSNQIVSGYITKCIHARWSVSLYVNTAYVCTYLPIQEAVAPDAPTEAVLSCIVLASSLCLEWHMRIEDIGAAARAAHKTRRLFGTITQAPALQYSPIRILVT
jgi:hypothetical protein